MDSCFVVPACSFKTIVHPQHEAIKAECDPWIVALSGSPAHSAIAQFWVNCNVPSFCSMVYAQCATERAVLLAKLITWCFASDTDDDDPATRGCDHDLGDVIGRRHALILACYAGQPLQIADSKNGGHVEDAATKGLAALHEVWEAIRKDLPPKMLARYLDASRDHLNANMIQSHYRAAGRLPGLEEYLKALRRPTSLVLPCLILLEYGLGIELDDETLASDLLRRLQDAVTDHVALYNDLFSCQVELAYGDQFSLPCIILCEEAAARAPVLYTFADAMQRAAQIVKEVDSVCVQLLAEVEADESVMRRPGVPAYLQGLRLWMSGNVEWSLHTVRYSHTCSISEGIVLPVRPRDQLIHESID